QGLAYARTDIGGAYRLNEDHTWTPLLDFVDNSRWNWWGIDGLATDPVEPDRLYLATGMYTNSWDPNNGQILISGDRGNTWTATNLPFKIGGNMPGRGINSILYFGARSGKGLWKSTDFGASWTNVTEFPSAGTYIPVPGDTNDYNTDIVGISWVTFDVNSGSLGNPTPRIFVGVANKGADNIFVSEDGGHSCKLYCCRWAAVPGQNTTYLPHKGVLSPMERVLYISYSDGAGPYDGSTGSLHKFNITSGTWTDISPVYGPDLYHGYGGIAVDYQRPGTLMVAALNSWWPDGQIFRSIDGGQSWSRLWNWGASGLQKHYSYSNSRAPWLGPNYVETNPGTLQIGWMMEALVIDPFDSNHWLYGTGATIYGGHDLLQWDTKHNVTIESLADGVEETAILGLVSPPSGPSLLSSVGDLGGFVHLSLTDAPSEGFTNPKWSTSSDIDYAGIKSNIIARVGTGDSSQGKQIALSNNSGSTWFEHPGAADDVSGGKVALSANGGTVLWRTNGRGVLVSRNLAAFSEVVGLPPLAAIASDKLENNIFYGAAGSIFYISTDGGVSFVERGSLEDSTSPFQIAVNRNKTGDVWVSTDKGLFHSTNSGETFSRIVGIKQAWSVSLGPPAHPGDYPIVFAAVDIDGVGYFRTDDAGSSWVQINDAGHGFGAASANCLVADSRVHGRVYIGTNGRGIFYGDPAA
ncbi:CEL6 protein, partial [Coprinopsis marcescibilis]